MNRGRYLEEYSKMYDLLKNLWVSPPHHLNEGISSLRDHDKNKEGLKVVVEGWRRSLKGLSADHAWSRLRQSENLQKTFLVYFSAWLNIRTDPAYDNHSI